jgi:hypothetical protein
VIEAMTGGNWFYLKGGEAVGPVSDQVINHLASAGHLFAESLVWTDSFDRWVALGDTQISDGAAVAPVGFSQEPPGRIAGLLVSGEASTMARIAFYLGWASLLVVPAPVALLAGTAALRDIRLVRTRSGRTVEGSGRAWFGIAGGMLGTLVLAWLITAFALR